MLAANFQADFGLLFSSSFFHQSDLFSSPDCHLNVSALSYISPKFDTTL